MMQTGFHQSYLQEFMWIYFLKLYKCYIFILWQDDVTKKLAFSSVNCSVRSSHICLVLTNLLRYFILLCFFFLSFSLLYQCLSAVQMKCHILLLSVFCGVLYFGCVLKYNHAVFYAFWVLCFSLKHVCISIISFLFFSSDVLPFYFSFLLSLLWFYIFKLFTLT